MVTNTQEILFNPFNVTHHFLYHLKTSEDPLFSDVFRGSNIRLMLQNRLRQFKRLHFSVV